MLFSNLSVTLVSLGSRIFDPSLWASYCNQAINMKLFLLLYSILVGNERRFNLI